MDDASIKSFGNNLLFAKSDVLEQGDEVSQDGACQLLTALHDSDSDDEKEEWCRMLLMQMRRVVKASRAMAGPRRFINVSH